MAEPPEVLPPLIIQSLKIALGAGLAWWIGPHVGLPHPFNAVLAVIILMQGDAYGSLRNSLDFLLGVAVGLLLGILAARFVGLSPLALAAVLLVCLLLGGRLRVSRQGLNNQIAISALLVLASGSAANLDRLWETVLGGGIGVLVAALVWPPNPVRRLRVKLRDLSGELREDVRRSLTLVGDPSTQADEANRRQVREHSEVADAAVAEVVPAQEALRWNPWHLRRIHDLSRLEDRLRLIAHLYRTVRALARQASESHIEGAGGWEEALPGVRAAGADVLE
ncbi:MAG: FUSC family protein, partial [Candidatus Dormiibacterota bacterium]